MERSELNLVFGTTMLIKMCGTQKSETGWKLKLTSSINMIDMPWELSKMDWLLDTFHMKYRKDAFISKTRWTNHRSMNWWDSLPGHSFTDRHSMCVVWSKLEALDEIEGSMLFQFFKRIFRGQFRYCPQSNYLFFKIRLSKL